MVSAENRTGLYVALPLYFCASILAGIVSFLMLRRAQKVQQSDAMSAHFISGRSLGAFVTTATLFASLFSGYTVVGIPEEAFRSGWVALRWLPATGFIVAGNVMVGPRMRKASLVRNHSSPCDLITDRFRSQLLRYTVLTLQVLPAWIYLAAQFVSINSTFNAMFGIDLENRLPTILIGILILALEWVGGLTSVALTDSIQGVLMIVGSLLVLGSTASIMAWADLSPQSYAVPANYQVPSHEIQFSSMWSLCVSSFGFLSLPHFIQRTYAADSIKALKLGYSVLTLGPYVLTMTAVYIGTVGAQLLRDEASVASPFTMIIERVMESSGFAYFSGTLMLTSSLAAIMSTADSLLIAVSHLLSAEVFYPLRPHASPRTVELVSKAISLLSLVIALLFAFYGGDGLSDLSAIQFGISFQAAPAFFLALYAPSLHCPHPWTIAAAGSSGTLVVFLMHYSYNLIRTPDQPRLDPGLIGMACNLSILVVGEAVLRLSRLKDRLAHQRITPAWDEPATSRFGDGPLTAELLSRMMKSYYEPAVHSWLAPSLLVLSLAMLPLHGAGQPALAEPLLLDGNATAPPNFAPPVVGGIPEWAFNFIMWNVPCTMLLLYVIYRMPNDMDVADAGDAPDTRQMSIEELSSRRFYDEPTQMASSARKTELSEITTTSAAVDVTYTAASASP